MRTADFKVVNLINIGDEVLNFDDLPNEEKREIGIKLNRQALTAVGYKEVERKEDKTS